MTPSDNNVFLVNDDERGLRANYEKRLEEARRSLWHVGADLSGQAEWLTGSLDGRRRKRVPIKTIGE